MRLCDRCTCRGQGALSASVYQPGLRLLTGRQLLPQQACSWRESQQTCTGHLFTSNCVMPCSLPAFRQRSAHCTHGFGWHLRPCQVDAMAGTLGQGRVACSKPLTEPDPVSACCLADSLCLISHKSWAAHCWCTAASHTHMKQQRFDMWCGRLATC